MTSALVLPGLRLRLTEIELCGWLAQAAPGDTLAYHRGFLALDRTAAARRLPEADRTELGRLARRAWWAAEQGLAYLLQRRHGSDDYSYLIVARPLVRTSPASFSALLAEEVA